MLLQYDSPKGRYAFDQFDRLSINGVAWQPLSHNDRGVTMLRADGSGVAEMFSHIEIDRFVKQKCIQHDRNYFRQDKAAQRASFTVNPDKDLSDAERKRRSVRAAFVEAFLLLQKEGKIKCTDESIEANKQFLADMASVFHANGTDGEKKKNAGATAICLVPASSRTIRRWMKSYLAGGVHALADNRENSGNRKRRRTPDEVAIHMRQVQKYCDHSRPTIETIHQSVREKFDVANRDRAARGLEPFKVPSREATRRAIRSLSAFKVCSSRHGVDVARKKFAPVGQGLDLTRPLERVEIDEWHVDLMTLMSDNGSLDLLTEPEKRSLGLDKSKDRWMVTLAICCTTRVIVGMKFSRNAKASAAVQVLEQATLDKGRWADGVGAQSPWNMHGTPEHIVADGGSAFRSNEFRTAAADLGITLEIAVGGIPYLRATVERIFRTIGINLLPRLSERTFSDVIEKGDVDPRKRAALTIEDFVFAMIRWTVDIYHNEEHEGLQGQTPAGRWAELSEILTPTLPPTIQRRRLVFGTRLQRNVSKEGVVVCGVQYHSDQLARLMNETPKALLDVSWHCEDIGAIMVRFGKDWIEVPAVHDRFAGVSAQAWLAAVRQIKAASPRQKAHRENIIFEAIRAITKRNEDALLTAGMLVQEWDDARIAREEDNLFMGFKVAAIPMPDRAPDGGFGMSIPDEPDDLEPGDLDPAPATPRTKGRAKPAQARNLPPAAPSGWTIEEPK